MPNSPLIKTTTPVTRSERNQFFEVILLVIVIALFSWFMLKPKAIAYITARHQRAMLEDQSKAVAENKQKLLTLVSKLNQSEAQVGVLEESLPLQDRTTTLALLIDSLAKTNGLTVASIAFGGQSEATTVVAGNKAVLEDPYGAERKLRTVNVILNVSGSLEQFLGLLGSLENATRIVDVQGIDISGQEGNVLNFKVKLNGYTYAPSA